MIRTTTFAAIAMTLLLNNVQAKPEFAARLPNGDNVDDAPALGHVGETTDLSVFGMAFKEAGLMWTTELCMADSDGDGQTNGEELGDPCCEWTPENMMLVRMTGLSDPGQATSKSDASTLGTEKCMKSMDGSMPGSMHGSMHSSSSGDSSDITAPSGEADNDSSSPVANAAMITLATAGTLCTLLL